MNPETLKNWDELVSWNNILVRVLKYCKYDILLIWMFVNHALTN